MDATPNLTRLSSEGRALGGVLGKGLKPVCHIAVNGLFLKYIFGYNIGIKLRILMLCALWGPRGPLTPGLPGTSDVFNDFEKWLLHDQPSPIPMVRTNSLVRLLVFFASGLWPTLSPDHFRYWVVSFVLSVSKGSAFVGTYFLCTRLLLEPARRQPFKKWAEWILQERFITFPYAVASYVLLLSGRLVPFGLFLGSSDLLHSYWSSMSDMSRIITRVCLMLPWILLKLLTTLPFFPIWIYRQKLKIPFWWACWQAKKAQRAFIQNKSAWQQSKKGRERSESPEIPSNRYEYQNLYEGQIRILEVIRCPKTRHLKCNLRHIVLKEAVPYDAISYTWGTRDDETYRMDIDGKWLDIRKNAYELLQDRATIFETRHIWIDCVCINQADDNEKSVQVPLMAEIYRRATRTIVWLGESPDVPQAFSLLGDLLDRPEIVSSHAPDAVKNAIEDSPASINARAQRYAYFEHLDPRFAALARLLQHEYFRRVWIVQEIAFSKRVHVRGGGSWMYWEEFARAMRLFLDPETYVISGREELYKHIKEPCALGEIIKLDATRTRERLGGERPALSILLANLWLPKATDARDMIWGFLNLSREAEFPEFAPDYAGQKSTEELYVAVAGLFQERNELQNILPAAGIGFERNLQNLPSWIPDWTNVPLCSDLRHELSNKPYKAGLEEPAQMSLVNPRRLSIRGIIVDTISEAMTGYFVSVNLNNEDINVARVKQMFKELEAEELASKLPEKYIDGTDREEAFWRTMIGDTGISPLPRAAKETLAAEGLPQHGLKLISTRPAPRDYHELYIQDRRPRLMARELGLTSPEDVLATGRTPRPLPGKKTADAIRMQEEIRDRETGDRRYVDALLYTMGGRKFAITENGYMALVPPLARAGDRVCVFFGMDLPFVVRETGTGSIVGGESGDDGDSEKKMKMKKMKKKTYSLVGECYVHGIMDGEAVAGRRGEEVDILID